MRRNVGAQPGVGGEHDAAALLERLALLAHGDGHDDFSGVVAGNRARLPGLFHVEVELELLLVAATAAAGSPASFGASLASLAARSCASRILLPQLVEGGDRVGLLLHVEVVDLLLAEVHDAAGRVVERGLPLAFDGIGRDDAFAEGLAAEHPHHRAEHAFEFHLALLARLDVGQQPGARTGRGACR